MKRYDNPNLSEYRQMSISETFDYLATQLEQWTDCIVFLRLGLKRTYEAMVWQGKRELRVVVCNPEGEYTRCNRVGFLEEFSHVPTLGVYVGKDSQL